MKLFRLLTATALALPVVLIASYEVVYATAARNRPMASLKDGAGKAKTTAYCSICHSVEYIPMNAGILDRQGWEKVVKKMVQTYGAPIQDADQTEIIDYLAKHYGK